MARISGLSLQLYISFFSKTRSFSRCSMYILGCYASFSAKNTISFKPRHRCRLIMQGPESLDLEITCQWPSKPKQADTIISCVWMIKPSLRSIASGELTSCILSTSLSSVCIAFLISLDFYLFLLSVRLHLIF